MLKYLLLELHWEKEHSANAQGKLQLQTYYLIITIKDPLKWSDSYHFTQIIRKSVGVVEIVFDSMLH